MVAIEDYTFFEAVMENSKCILSHVRVNSGKIMYYFFVSA